MSDENPIFIPNHKYIAAKERLLAQFRNKPRILSLVRALCHGVQLVEDDLFGILVSTTFTAATQNDLDQWGALVGQEREGLDDVDYRRIISARILANSSIGTTDEIIRIVQLVSEPSTVTHKNIYPACFQVVIRRSVYMSDALARLTGILARAVKPAGVGMVLIEAADGYFGYYPDPEASPLDVGLFCRHL